MVTQKKVKYFGDMSVTILHISLSKLSKLTLHRFEEENICK